MESIDDKFARLAKQRKERETAEIRLTMQYWDVPLDEVPEQYRLIVDSWRRHLGMVEEPQP